MIINKSQTYVVISQTKDHYSAYEAYIDATSGTLYIQINRHKFFGVETTPTTLVRFNAIKTQMSESIAYNDYFTQYRDEIGS